MSETVPESAVPVVPAGRGVTATWWYTYLSALLLPLMLLVMWGLYVVSLAGEGPGHVVLFVVVSSLWLAVFAVLARPYRAARLLDSWWPGRAPAVVVVLAVACAAAVGVVSASATLFAALSLVPLCVLPWPRGVRGRVTALATLVITAVAVVDVPPFPEPVLIPGWIVLHAFAVATPISVVSMLWWWDIVRELDRARTTEARLAATQERLRLARDVHDLQGHHLQVIALQLELAERLLAQGTDAALAHLRQAQRSVDEARTGTRDLAMRFRGVPLADELANAADLLRASGYEVEVRVGPGVHDAPSAILGPIIRESTTNILKHGSGRTARLDLVRDGTGWLFRAVNDAPARPEHAVSGSGVRGMSERARQAGGTVEIAERETEFVVEARVPEGSAA